MVSTTAAHPLAPWRRLDADQCHHIATEEAHRRCRTPGRQSAGATDQRRTASSGAAAPQATPEAVLPILWWTMDNMEVVGESGFQRTRQTPGGHRIGAERVIEAVGTTAIWWPFGTTLPRLTVGGLQVAGAEPHARAEDAQ